SPGRRGGGALRAPARGHSPLRREARPPRHVESRAPFASARHAHAVARRRDAAFARRGDDARLRARAPARQLQGAASDRGGRMILELAKKLRAREASSVELTKHFLGRIGRDKTIAFITVCEREALEAARAADEALKSGRAESPLLGVPMA